MARTNARAVRVATFVSRGSIGDAESVMARFTVTLHGAPVATVDLPIDRVWAGGRVSPLPSFERVARLLSAAAHDPSFAAKLL